MEIFIVECVLTATMKICFLIISMMRNVALNVIHGLSVPVMIKIVRFVQNARLYLLRQFGLKAKSTRTEKTFS